MKGENKIKPVKQKPKPHYKNAKSTVGKNINDIGSIEGYEIRFKDDGTRYLKRKHGMAGELDQLKADKDGIIYNVDATKRKKIKKNAKKMKTPAQIAASKGYKGITNTKNGCANFAKSKYIYRYKNKKAIIKIKMTGTRKVDYKQAYDNLNIPKSLRRTLDADYTWHHLDDFNPKTGECTMQLVLSDAHKATYPHKGAVAQYEKYFKIEYK